MPLNKTITKKLFILFLLLFSVCNGQAQTTQQALSFGEGIISIGQFNFPPGGTIPPWPTYFTKELMPYNFTYYIKGDKIFRKDNLDNIPPTETNDTLKQNGRDLVTQR